MLPPLAALRAFDAAARHLSFTKAAEELNVTQSAVSRHVRSLEDFLGTDLFERRHRAVMLTAEGERYQRDLAGIFGQIDSATRLLRRGGERDVLKIQTYTTFTMRWLIPRMRRFHALYPDIDVRLTASLAPVDFASSDVHGAVRSGEGEWPVRADKLCETYLVPVCAPRYVNEALPIRTPEDLARTTLLHSLARPRDWERWFQGVGVGGWMPEKGHRFESSSMAYQAACQGLGVAIGQRFLVEDDLRSGQLITPLARPVHCAETYYFLSSPRFAGAPMLERFREWLIAEAKSTSDTVGYVVGTGPR